MALSRRTQRMNGNIWPGFVDAMTGLLLVLMFVLTIFMVIQFVLRETISGQATQLDDLAGQVASLTNALGLSQAETATLTEDNAAQSERIAVLVEERDQTAAALQSAQNRITGFEAQVAGLLAQRADLSAQVAGLEDSNADLLSEQEQLTLALATARSEVDAEAEAARLAAARRDALQALVDDLNAQTADLTAQTSDQSERISDLEAAQLVDAAAAAALRERLETADTELTAMTLSLEEQRKRAEETLTLLAAANAGRDALASDLSAVESTRTAALSEAERQAALLATANAALSEEQELSAAAQRQTALLNEQVAALRQQVGTLQSLLNVAQSESEDADVQIEQLGAQLNTALARVAAEERRRAALEEAERVRLEAENQNLERFRSDFFGELRGLVEGLDGVQIAGDRFVFSSEVLFGTGDATLSARGRQEIAKVATLLRQIADRIPDNIDWIIRVDGHTDDVPLSGNGQFADNWQLSQARALSVVKYMESLGIPPNRMSANGFAEFQPLNPADTDAARAQNRRIELKLTER
ncbi:peptidoglycan -binding protein [Loktanella sp. DJP18]|uniref:peptidoglycan -binding protein n=1 Tax=Loktanella sp. DJP18 TaxID=3409788 RepID=UPI003BB4EB78